MERFEIVDDDQEEANTNANTNAQHDDEQQESSGILAHQAGNPRFRSLSILVAVAMMVAILSIGSIALQTGNNNNNNNNTIDSKQDTNRSEPRPTGCLEPTMECMENHYLKNTRDRLGHDAPMHKGQALCNSDDETFPGVLYQFGLTPSGALVWQKCSSLNPSDSELVVLRAASTNNDTNDPSSLSSSLSLLPREKVWFQMTSDATWQIIVANDDGQEFDSPTTTTTSNTSLTVVWEQAVQNRPLPIQESPRCLNKKPVLDCPYIHFRRHGDIIMNYIDPNDGWVACKSHKKCYPDLWE